MKQPIATIDTVVGKMTIYFNGPGVPMTGENETMTEELDYIPESFDDAANAISQMYGNYTVWQLEFC